MRGRRIIAIAAVALVGAGVVAWVAGVLPGQQRVTVVWEQTLGGKEDDEGRAIAIASDGGVYIVGSTKDEGTKKKNLWVLKFDAHGQLVWAKTPDRGEEGWGWDVAATSDGGVLAAAQKRKGYDGWLLKFDAAGTLLWEKIFERSVFFGLIPTADGGAWAVRKLFSDQKPSKTEVSRLDAQGNMLWGRVVGQSLFVRGFVRGADGSFFVTGYFIEKGSRSNTTLFLMKLDEEGRLLWERQMGGITKDKGYDVAAAPDGGAFVTGVTTSKGPRDDNLWVLRFDSEGVLLWERVLGGNRREAGSGIAATPDGGIMVVGTTNSKGPPLFWGNSAVLWILKLDRRGKLVGEETLNGMRSAVGHDIAVAADGSIFAAAQKRVERWKGFASLDYELWVLKLNMD